MSSPLVHKLRREVTANPKRAGVLGLLLLVAAWFWAPLVAKWCSSSDAMTDSSNAAPATAGAAKASVPPTVTTTPVAATVPGAEASKTPAWSWQQLVQWIEKDPQTVAANNLGVGRDPFGPSPGELAAAQQRQAEKVAVPPKEMTPGDAGLVLTSTIVGLGRSVALISGEAYSEGTDVPSGDGKASFRLVEIRPRQIVLERQGKRFQLELPTADVVRTSEVPADSPAKQPSPRGGGRLKK